MDDWKRCETALLKLADWLQQVRCSYEPLGSLADGSPRVGSLRVDYERFLVEYYDLIRDNAQQMLEDTGEAIRALEPLRHSLPSKPPVVMCRTDSSYCELAIRLTALVNGILELNGITLDKPHANYFLLWDRASEQISNLLADFRHDELCGWIKSELRDSIAAQAKAGSQPQTRSGKQPADTAPSVNAAVMDLFSRSPESIGWSLRRIADAIGRSKSAVAACPAYASAKLVKAQSKIDRLSGQSSSRSRGVRRPIRPDK